MAKTKRLNVKQVESELRLIACGANSGEFDEEPDLISAIGIDAAMRLYYAILGRWFLNDRNKTYLAQFDWLDEWKSIASLAAFIVRERKRLDEEVEQ